jgi:hypothetical protein
MFDFGSYVSVITPTFCAVEIEYFLKNNFVVQTVPA